LTWHAWWEWWKLTCVRAHSIEADDQYKGFYKWSSSFVAAWLLANGMESSKWTPVKSLISSWSNLWSNKRKEETIRFCEFCNVRNQRRVSVRRSKILFEHVSLYFGELDLELIIITIKKRPFYLSSSEPVDCCDWELVERWELAESWDVLVRSPLLGVRYWQLAGRTVTIRFELLATIMSVTWSSVFPWTSIPFTSRTSSLTPRSPVDSAKPPGTSLSRWLFNSKHCKMCDGTRYSKRKDEAI